MFIFLGVRLTFSISLELINQVYAKFFYQAKSDVITVCAPPFAELYWIDQSASRLVGYARGRKREYSVGPSLLTPSLSLSPSEKKNTFTTRLDITDYFRNFSPYRETRENLTRGSAEPNWPKVIKCEKTGSFFI